MADSLSALIPTPRSSINASRSTAKALMSMLREAAAALTLLAREADRFALRRLAAATLLCIAAGSLAAVAPLTLKGLIDAVAAPDPAHGVIERGRQMVWLLAGYLAAQCVMRLLAEIRPVLASAAEQRLLGALRERYFDKLLHLPLAFHLERRSGAQLQDLQQGCTGYQVILFHAVNSVLPVAVEAVVVMSVVAALGQPLITATIAATALAYLLVMRQRTRQLHDAANDVTTASAEVQARLSEGLMNYEPIKCFGAERHVLAGFKAANASLEASWSTLQRLRAQRGVAVIAVFTVSLGTGLILATLAVFQGSLTVGGFVLMNLYMLQVMRPLEALSAAVRDVCQALAFVQPLMRVLQAPVTAPATAPFPPGVAPPPVFASKDGLADEPASTWTPRPPAPAISFRGVELTLGSRGAILQGLDLDVAAGCTTAIVGASGSGKSTLIRLLLRLLEPGGGSIHLNGAALDSMSPAEVRRLVALVPQDVMLFSTSIAANIALGSDEATRTQIEEAARLAGLHPLIASLPGGYDTPIGERGLKVSGGERQRIAIARAILRDPQILVLDEATSMLDTATESRILENLRGFSPGRTTLMVAHRLSSIQHADHIAVLAAGRVVEQGIHDTLLASRGPYAALWQAQQVLRAHAHGAHG